MIRTFIAAALLAAVSVGLARAQVGQVPTYVVPVASGPAPSSCLVAITGGTVRVTGSTALAHC